MKLIDVSPFGAFTLFIAVDPPSRWSHAGRASKYDLLLEKDYFYLFALGLSVLLILHPEDRP